MESSEVTRDLEEYLGIPVYVEELPEGHGFHAYKGCLFLQDPIKDRWVVYRLHRDSWAVYAYMPTLEEAKREVDESV